MQFWHSVYNVGASLLPLLLYVCVFARKNTITEHSRCLLFVILLHVRNITTHHHSHHHHHQPVAPEPHTLFTYKNPVLKIINIKYRMNEKEIERRTSEQKKDIVMKPNPLPNNAKFFFISIMGILFSFVVVLLFILF